ncbi:hypothetical protein KJ359_002756 [Pestalotiopsis sp. 9143b]|nr:hypothetical protein KJ359_002756 [Pestalotiopsis sp. 9143b]
MSPDKEKDTIPLPYWYIVGGTGPPPTRSAFLRMASERKAAHRAGVRAKEARREAVAKAHAENPIPNFLDGLKQKLGLGKSGKDSPSREELMSKYGGKDKSLRRSRQMRNNESASAAAAAEPQDSSPGGNVPDAVIVEGGDVTGGDSHEGDAGGTESPAAAVNQVDSASNTDDAAVGSTGDDETKGEKTPDVQPSDKNGPIGDGVSPADPQQIDASALTPGEGPSSGEPVPGPSTQS